MKINYLIIRGIKNFEYFFIFFLIYFSLFKNDYQIDN